METTTTIGAFFGSYWQVLLVSIITPGLSWYFGRKHLIKSQIKKEEAQAGEAELNNISENFKVYQGLIDDLDARFKKRIEELELDLEKMTILNTELRREIRNQEKYIKKLKTKTDSYEGKE